MQQTLGAIQSVHPLDEDSVQQLLAFSSVRQISKSTFLFYPELRHRYIHFIEKGVARAYVHHKGKEVTFWFGQEGDVVFPYRTYVYGESSYETVQMLEDSILCSFPMRDWQQLMVTNSQWATWGRKFAEKALVSMEERFISYQFKSAKERYHELIERSPQMLNRIQLQYIASYLGITQVSLSRIRGDY